MTEVLVTTTCRAAGEVLAWSKAEVDPASRAAVGQLPSSMGRIAAYHFGWCDENGNPTRADGGKAIRPALVLLAAEAVGGMPRDAVPAAVAVELVHNFSLLHDDVMDRDTTRRHRPTAWTVFGTNAAILAGDALQTLAVDVLAASRHVNALDAIRLLGDAVVALLDGQAADLGFETRDDVTVPECVAMARGKTGALLGAACALGAMYGGATPEQVHHLQGFGESLGLAFQFVDDLLGIWGDPAVTGKSAQNDLECRKKSLPVVHALTSGTAAGDELAALYHRPDQLTTAELVHAAELIDAAGGRAWAQQRADELLAEALHHLESAAPTARTSAELGLLAQLVVRRDH